MKRLLVSLDELLDTRLGLISMLNPELAASYLNKDNPRYLKRMRDDIIWNDLGITELEWYNLWERRNKETLQNSIVTHIPACIQQILYMYQDSNEVAIGDYDFEVDVNTYPYQLSREELNELKSVLEELLPVVLDFNFVRFSLKGLTPSTVKNKYDYVILYDWRKWSILHTEELKQLFLAKQHFFVPRLFNELPDEETYKDEMMKRVIELDPFKLVESAISYRIGLTHIAASDFGPILIDPMKADRQTEDLDDLLNQSGFSTPDSSLYDPQFQFRLE